MKKKTKEKLKIAFEICEEEERSIEYTLQFLQDYANVDFDCALNFLERQEKPKQGVRE
jgi:hypothetical protein